MKKAIWLVIPLIVITLTVGCSIITVQSNVSENGNNEVSVSTNTEEGATSTPQPVIQDIPDPGPAGFSVDIQTMHYEYINDDTSTEITVDRLEISGHSKKKIEQSINRKLEDIAWIYDISPEEEEGLSYNMQCDYTLLAERYLSARYYLQYYHQTAIHPWRGLDSITIDLETGQEITLTDIMTIDERLLQKLVGREFDHSEHGGSQIIGMDEGALEECDYEDFYRQISEYNNFTLNENSIGLIVEVPHYLGDYWVLAFSYDSVSELIHPWFAALENISLVY